MKTKTEKHTPLKRQLEINNKNTKPFEIRWKITKGSLPRTQLPGTFASVDTREGTSTVYADNGETAIVRFHDAYTICGRQYEVVSCQEIKCK